jgi:hypothetical protein
MKHLITFENFQCNFTLDFIYDRITGSEFISHLEFQNENWISDSYEKVKWKVIEYLWTFLEESKKIGFKIFSKVFTFLKWIWNKIKSFKEKQPIIFKIVTITLLVFIILILSSSVAHAQVSGQPLDESQINLAIGFINDVREHHGGIKGFTNLDVNKAIAYLIKLRDAHGVVNPSDINTFGQDSVTLADRAIKASEEMVKDARIQGQSSTVYQYCLDLLQKGSDFITYSYRKTSSREVVTLGIK